ncbi:hypothetical protein ANN_00196 [Periplaneta americana]|uniref:Reverse transcriptase domain-containing protein n=1 Tax=Periplaneta americana TaxID=6978 RepID=A0ABQ8TSZ5_PERAM|nr:hypothetical protein ANN_00196 [Periplaneta americana]
MDDPKKRKGNANCCVLECSTAYRNTPTDIVFILSQNRKLKRNGANCGSTQYADENKLNKDIDSIVTWTKKFHLNINPGKTQAIILGHKRQTDAVKHLDISPVKSTEDAIEIITKAIFRVTENETIIIAGDLNCRLDKPNRKSKLVLEVLNEEGFKLVNKEDLKTYYCHNGSSAIDLVLYRGKGITLKGQKGMWSSAAAPIRKHIPIETTFTLTTNEDPPRRKEKENTLRKIDSTQLEHYEKELTYSRQLIRNGKTDEALKEIQTIIEHVAIPKKPRKAQPWFDRQCYEARKVILSALNIARENGAESQLRNYAEKRRKYKTLLKEKRAEYIEEDAKRKAETAKFDPFLALRRKNKTQTSVLPISAWEKHFTELLNKNGRETAYQIMGTSPKGRQSASPITAEEVRGTIMKSKPKKAPGPDRICTEVIKDSIDILTPLWTELFNSCLNTGTIPKIWRTSTIKILHKGKGDPEDPNTYRGIALENSLFKICMKILTRRLQEESRMPECQFGFTPGRRVTLQSTANSFSYHIQERTAAATRAIHQINDLTRLSLETAMVLLKTVIAPIVTYGITLIWEKLTLTDLERIEKVKARFLKCTLGIGRNAPSRLVYEMTRETFYVEDIRLQILLQSTQPYRDLLERREDKRRTIDPDFYATGAMVDRNWTKENQTQRRAITRFAIHGFHHKLCKTKSYHEPCESCVCELCDLKCEHTI